MQLKVFCLYDMKSSLYATPRFYQTAPQAMRMLSLEHSDGKTIPGMYPADFQVMELGTFDDEYGCFEMKVKPEVICTLKDVFDADERQKAQSQAPQIHGDAEAERQPATASHPRSNPDNGDASR